MIDLDNEYPPAEPPQHGAVSDELYSYYARIFNAITASPESPLFSVRQDMANRVWGVVEPLLTRVLAPDEATIERLARAMHDNDGPRVPWSELPDSVRLTWRRTMRMALRALADTSAQARHTADDAKDGGEHG